MAYPSQFVDIQNDVINRARLLSSIDLPSVKDWINKTYFQVCVEAESTVTTTTINCVAGTSKYTLASSIAKIKQAAVKPAGTVSFNPPLILTTLDEILQRRQNGGDSQTTGTWATHYTLLGSTDLELWPTPSQADVITVYYVAFPTALSANGDVPVIEEPYSTNLLVYGGCAQAGDFKGDPATADWANEFDTWMGKYMAYLQAKRGQIPGQFHQWGDGWSEPFSGSLTGA